jgi:hypothetical protein
MIAALWLEGPLNRRLNNKTLTRHRDEEGSPAVPPWLGWRA